MRRIEPIFLLVTLLACRDGIKQTAPTKQNLSLSPISIIDANFPLTLSNINLQDTPNITHSNDEIENKIYQTVYSYYFNDCSGDSAETYFKLKDVYIGTIRLHDSLQTIYLVVLNHFPGGQVNSRILFYNNSSKQFIDKPLDFNIHALYDYNNGQLTPTNLKEQFQINSPEIQLIDYDKDNKNDFKLIRLYHNGAANAIETAILRVKNMKIDTLNFNQKTIGTDKP